MTATLMPASRRNSVVPRMSRIALVTLIVFNVVPLITVLGGTAAAGTITYGGNLGTSLGNTCSSPGNQTVTPDLDTYVHEANMGNHSNGDLQVSRGPANTARSLIRFPLPTLPAGCAVIDASLRVRHINGDAFTVQSVTRAASSWGSNVNWNTQPGEAGTPVTINTQNQWNQWSVDQLVADMYQEGNYGFFLRNANEAGPFNLSTHDSAESVNPPQLYVEWGNVPGTTVSVNTTSAVTAGNSIIVSFGIDAATGVGGVVASDSAGNIYSIDADATNPFGGRSVILSAHDVNALPAGSTITVTHPASGTRGMSVNHFSGLAPSGTLDDASAATGNSSVASAGGVTATQPNELIFGSFTVADDTPSFAPGGGFTQTTPVLAPGYGGIFSEHRIVSSAGTYTPTGSLGSIEPWAGTAASYKMDIEDPVVEVTDPSDGGVTTDSTPSISGTSSFANSDSENISVRIHSGPNTSGPVVDSPTVTRAGDGTWSVDTTSLPDGQYTVVAEQEDGATNVGTSAPITFFVDTTLPDPPAITGPSPNPGNDSSPE